MLAPVTTLDLGTIAVTTGAPDAPRLVCATHYPSVILDEFERDDLEPGSTCGDCGVSLNHPQIDLDDPGALLGVLLNTLIRNDVVEVCLEPDGVQFIDMAARYPVAFIHGVFTHAEAAGYLHLDRRDIRDLIGKI